MAIIIRVLTINNQNIRKSPSAVELLKELAEEGSRIFNIQQFAELAPKYGISPNYVRVALHYLHHNKWIVPIKKGIYAMGPALLGSTPLHEFEIAMALVQPAAISYWSALQYHGLTDQVPRIIHILTTTKANVPRIRNKIKSAASCYEVEGITYQFTKVRPDRFFGVQKVWIGEARVSITDPERTLIDGIQKPQYCGDLSEVINAFKMLGTKLDLKKIIGYAMKMDTTTVKRLGWILSELHFPDADLKKLKEIPVKGYRKLDSTQPVSGPYNKVWKIQENITGV